MREGMRVRSPGELVGSRPRFVKCRPSNVWLRTIDASGCRRKDIPWNSCVRGWRIRAY